MRPIDGDALAYKIANWDMHDTIHRNPMPNERLVFEWTKGDLYNMVTNEPTLEIKRAKAVWQYHNDEHGTWWGCTNCSKISKYNPHDKLFCSRCGCEMRMEA